MAGFLSGIIGNKNKNPPTPEDKKRSSELNNQGIEFMSERRFREAAQCFGKAVKIDPQNHSVWYNKGTSLLKMNKFWDALLCFDKSLKINPNDANTLSNIGHCYFGVRDYAEAEKSYQKALEIDPENADTWLSRGINYYNMDNTHRKEALSCFNRTLELDPKHEQAWFSKAHAEDKLSSSWTLVKDGSERSEAIAAYREYLRLTTTRIAEIKPGDVLSTEEIYQLKSGQITKQIQEAKRRLEKLEK